MEVTFPCHLSYYFIRVVPSHYNYDCGTVQHVVESSKLSGTTRIFILGLDDMFRL